MKTRAGLGALVAVPLMALLAGCPTRPKESGLPPAPEPVAPLPAGEGRPFEVVPDESLLTLLVYRAGALARLGHNHVIASRELTGTVRVADDLARSSFRLRFPVASLTVDEADLRSAAGADFSADVPDSAKEGTKRNMLSEALLDGARYPTIELASQSLEIASGDAGGGMLNAHVQVRVRDQTRTIAVPVRYELTDQQLAADGELSLNQTDLGLKPFSALAGALEVRDDMTVRFHIVARPAAP